MAAETVRIDQTQETSVTARQRARFGYRYAYARSADSRAGGDPGQDYLVLREDGVRLAFALCDGVGQSFYGDLAARYLVDALVAWLTNEVPVTMEETVLKAALAAYLQALTGPATEMVAAHVLPVGIPSMLRDVLEQKRRLGSESMFVCGRLDLPCAEYPEGRLILAWMGDSRLRIWGPQGERTPKWVRGGNSAERWSTRRGLVNGEPHVIVLPVSFRGRPRVQSVMAYSDGLALLDRYSSPPSDAELSDLIDRAGKLPTSDDISFVEVWTGSRPPRIASAIPRVVDLIAAVVNGSLQLRWAGAEGASHYELDVRGKETFWAETPELFYRLDVAAPGLYEVRVRAWRAGEYGPWSESVNISVPAPEAAPKLADVPASRELLAAPELVPTMPVEYAPPLSPAPESRRQALQPAAGPPGAPSPHPARGRGMGGRQLRAAGFMVTGLLVLCAVLALLLKGPGGEMLRRRTPTPTAVVTEPSVSQTSAIPSVFPPAATHVAPWATPTHAPTLAPTNTPTATPTTPPPPRASPTTSGLLESLELGTQD